MYTIFSDITYFIHKYHNILLKHINLGNQFHYKKYKQKLHDVEFYDGKWKHKYCQYFDPFPEIMFTELRITWCCDYDLRNSKTCVFIFHHSIQHDEASGYIFKTQYTTSYTHLKVEERTDESEKSSLKVITVFTFFRSSCWQMLYKVGVLKSFSKFTEKQLHRSLCFTGVSPGRPACAFHKRKCFSLLMSIK